MEREMDPPEDSRTCPECRDSLTYCQCEKDHRKCPFCGDEDCDEGECVEADYFGDEG